MATFLSRLLTAIAPPPAVAEAKAATGPGVWSMSNYAPVTSLSTHPSKLMAEAEALFHTNGWVAQAERAIAGRYVKADWHIEDGDGETVDPATATGPSLAAYNLLAHPSPNRTRRGMWSLTLRHMGLPGNAFWYLDQRDLLGGIPLELLYINPVRMTPVDDESNKLLGWVMDAPDNPVTGRPGQAGIPFELDELRHFILDEPDFGHYGIGIAEAAASKVILDKLADRHAAQVLDSGGRIAGLLAPKTGATMNNDDWQALLRDYRNIVGDPDSAKRLHIVKGPVDFTETAANPTEMQLLDLMQLTRENVFGLWGVPLSQIGIMQSSGLNSGEHVKFEEAALWQGAIEFRAQPFEEQVQSILDLFKPLGADLKLVVDKAQFDDEQPLYENAERAKVVPMTVNQRLDQVGLDPLDPAKYGAFGEAIFIDNSMVRIDPLAPLPEPEQAPPAVEQMPEMVKASPLQTLRARTEVTWEPRIRKVILGLLGQQRGEIAARIEAKHSHLSRRPTDTAVWWNSDKERRRLEAALEPLVLAMARDVANRASDKFPAKAMDAGYLDTLTTFIRKRVGERITSISETTRDDISRLVQAGVKQGLSPTELAQTISEATAFGEARAEMISRTETMFAYNDASLRTYNELGVERVQAVDGDVDDVCAARNGREFTVDEAYGISDHPNGTLDWIPIVPAKAEISDPAPMWAAMKAAIEYGQRPEPVIPAPIVNVEAAPAPVVNMDSSQFAAALADFGSELRAVLATKPRKTVVLRDEAGRIIGTEEQ